MSKKESSSTGQIAQDRIVDPRYADIVTYDAPAYRSRKKRDYIGGGL